MENSLVKIGDTIINLDNVTVIKRDGDNLIIDFVSGRKDHVQRITGDLEMVHVQGGGYPSGKGVVNRPVSSSK